MDFGICVQSHINDIDYVVAAEELGFSHAWSSPIFVDYLLR